ncbi:MAG: histidine--tRNA ligase [Parachlamydiaceae bacterium]|nr:histidine--tRNA ligase [Parachlamydiaceae bacterium]
MSKNIAIAPGVFDILPNDPQELWRSSYLWNFVENEIRRIATEYGYQEIRTPIFERTEVFHRGVGETSDIVSKEMYTFIDKGERSMTLRPEGTAAVMRAFIENQLHQQSSLTKIFYICPMFRYERSQAGRYRQHHQFGAEAIGNGSPEQDAELIDLLFTLYNRLGLTNLNVNINSIGDTESRISFRKALQDYLHNHFNDLSEDSKKRFETNPLRILDSKDPKDKMIAAGAPSILEYLNTESKDHFETLKNQLTALNIPFEVNIQLVRGLDYYNRTVFEITSGELGAQNSVAGGGRYDGLLKTLGGPDLPASGFGCGLERLIQTMIKQQAPLPAPPSPLLYFIPLGEAAKNSCFILVHHLRQEGIHVEMDLSGRKLGKVMQHANQLKAKFVSVVGENELASGIIELKDMASGKTLKISTSEAAKFLLIEQKSPKFMELWKEMSEPFTDPALAEFFVQKINASIASSRSASNALHDAIESIKEIVK